MKLLAIGVPGQSISMEANMHWQLLTELEACKYVKFTQENKGRKLIRLAYRYMVISRERSSLIKYGYMVYRIKKLYEGSACVCKEVDEVNRDAWVLHVSWRLFACVHTWRVISMQASLTS